MILAIDSSIGSTVAVVDPATDAVLADCSSDVPRGHAEVIGTLIERALDDAAVSPADITHVAAGMGPGPFTGLRIGIAAARAFAVGRGIPVVPVVSHDAAALEILTRDPDATFVIVTDARRRENAVSAYAGLDSGIPARIAGPELLPNTDDTEAYLAEHLSIARGPDGSGEIVRRSPTSQALGEQPHTTHISAGAIGILAARLLRRGAVPDLEPLYLRAPDAKVPGAVKRVST
ncbi:MAG: tRNA (adenosine(37)-N6)-threonylcarbamoyltransferase complex dimerization subunit type 1 TsaB [Microbacterium gubbeenense]|uniref:tRNA (adenosine(37)-N6)-threonylcarbamoyltransferase complex dimerization subunit type 1 TsaB n=1 Tax=Microbacterium gubbeenense TaxID=159896 RepID=UPI0003F8F76B|nr:tRNA (adenosine(37)-N6)-threonylcarbamoyltransferase complex dimerization subunit type 1 TsaB [Microbacterium gubbeenense]